MRLSDRVRAVMERSASVWWFVIPGLVLAVGLPQLGDTPFRFEEGRRVAQALAIMDGGSWWRLETFGIGYFAKPPLMPWLIALAAAWTGHADEFAARLPGMASVAGAAFLAAAFCARIARQRPAVAALAAGIMFMASQTVFARIRLAETDALSTFLVACAFSVWAAARLRGRIGAFSWTAVSFILAAALLTKGPPPVLFVLLPIGVVAFRGGQVGEIGAFTAATIAAFIPLAAWYWLNLDVIEADSMASELRLRPQLEMTLGEYLANIPVNLLKGAVQSVPAIIAGWLWIVSRRAWAWNADRWLHHALFLYAVPVFFAMLVWPDAQGRYVMPAIWPLAVLGGLWLSENWDRVSARTALAVVLLLFLSVQTVELVAAGRGEAQAKAVRANAALRAAFTELPHGRLLILSEGTDYNRYVHVGRNAAWLPPDRVDCPPTARYLLAEDSMAVLIRPADWTPLKTIEDADATLFERIADTPCG